ncbi:hypothetical protein [Mitsuaria sp. GD03876]|uniref:InlB B-repeat-containing protein n=1 Tax=Mitsuaria sp. GD03876 TaxID=2975399 RepID=UPI00244B9804|nr:hypothetical protein [Mitsuaria sp. GD03876]MDH0863869.1 hypothetical protein [Mitsuaria sp. GD03876]
MTYKQSRETASRQARRLGWLAVAVIAASALTGCLEDDSDDPVDPGPGGPGGPGTPVTYAVTASVTGNGKITSNTGGLDCGTACTATVAANTVLQLTATPAAGQVFDSWGGACATTATPTCSVTVTQATAVSATFRAAPTATFGLTVAVTGNGKVTSLPAGIDCGTACSATYAAATQVVLTAAPAQGQVLQGWGGACSGTAAACTVTMSEARNVTAAFAAAPAAAKAWQAAALMEDSNDFNVGETNQFADAHLLSAVDGSGNAMILWEQSDGTPDGRTRKVFSRRYTAGQGWAAAVVVPGLTTTSEREEMVSGRLLMDAAGTAVWVRENFQTRRYAVGTGWTATPFAPTNGGGGELTDARIDADGNVHLVGIGNGDVRYSRLPAGSNQWPAFVDISQSSLETRAAQLAVSAQGAVTVAWKERNPGDSNDSMKATRFTGGAWQTPVRIEEILTNVQDTIPRLGGDAAGNAIAAWHQGNAIYASRYDVATNAWSTPAALDTTLVSSISSIELAMNADGKAVITWSASTSPLKAATYVPGTGFSAAAMAHGYAAGHGVSIDGDGRAVLVYRSPDLGPPLGSVQNLYARELPWGGAWSAATLLESGAPEVKGGFACSLNPAGQAVCVWAQYDTTATDDRNSLWSAIRK